MNDQNQTPVSNPNTPPPNRDWREGRRVERMARREARGRRRAGRPYEWVRDVIPILLGTEI